MTTPAHKRFKTAYGPIADAVARANINQEDREKIADALTDALSGGRDPLAGAEEWDNEVHWMLPDSDPRLDLEPEDQPG